jgi:agmatinase
MSDPYAQLPPNLRAQMFGPFYLGPATFNKVPGITEPEQLDDWAPDVAIVGAPWDDSVLNRPGARFGPRAVRVANYVYPEWHLDLDVAPFSELTVVDYGDAVCPPGMVQESHEAIRSRVRDIAERGAIPIIIGGDHSITYPAGTAVADVYGRGSVGLIHFDAHADTAPDVYGNLASHGTPMRRLIESGAIPGNNFVQVGLRGFWPPPDVLEWMQEQGMHSHFMDEVVDLGAHEVMSRAIAEALNGSDYIYLSLDIDVLDPGFAPGTGTPEPGGMTPRELIRAVRRIVADTNVVAVDLVEVCPPYDTSDITAQNANRCIMEAISMLAKKKKDSA